MSVQVVLMVSTFSGQGPAHLGFSLSSMNSRVNNFLSRNMFITPPAPQHLGQHGALLELRLLHFNVALETQMRGQDPICEP